MGSAGAGELRLGLPGEELLVLVVVAEFGRCCLLDVCEELEEVLPPPVREGGHDVEEEPRVGLRGECEGEEGLELLPDGAEDVLELDGLVAAEEIRRVRLSVEVEDEEGLGEEAGEELEGRRLPNTRLPDQQNRLSPSHAPANPLHQPTSSLRQRKDFPLAPTPGRKTFEIRPTS